MRRFAEILQLVVSLVTVLAMLGLLAVLGYLVLPLPRPACPVPPPTVGDWQPGPPPDAGRP